MALRDTCSSMESLMLGLPRGLLGPAYCLALLIISKARIPGGIAPFALGCQIVPLAPEVLPYRVCGPLRLHSKGWPLKSGGGIAFQVTDAAVPVLEWQARLGGGRFAGVVVAIMGKVGAYVFLPSVSFRNVAPRGCRGGVCVRTCVRIPGCGCAQVCLSVCLFVCMYVCLSVCMSLCMHVCVCM